MTGTRIGAVAVALALLATACTRPADRPTAYSKADTVWTGQYGYSDKAIGGGEFSVAFTASHKTGRERTAELALLRAAHLTREQGSTHFVVVSRKMVESERSAVIIGGIPLPGGVLMVPIGENLHKEPTAALVIRVVQPDAAVPAEALAADDVIRRLGPGPAGQ